MSKPMYSEVQDTSKLPAHLAKYLQPVKKKKKKRRTGGGLTIIDDDLSLSRKGGTQELYSEEEDEQPKVQEDEPEEPAFEMPDGMQGINLEDMDLDMDDM